jgi:hypothetical protein
VRLPDCSRFGADVTGISYLLAKDFKYLLYQQGVCIPPACIKLLYKHRLLGDVEMINEIEDSEMHPIEVIAKVTGEDSWLLHYDDFILRTVPKHQASNVSIHTSIKVVLQANPMGHIIYTPSLLHHAELATLIPTTDNPTSHVDSSATFSERIMLLEVEEFLDTKLEKLRIDMGSEPAPTAISQCWQRYSR